MIEGQGGEPVLAPLRGPLSAPQRQMQRMILGATVRILLLTAAFIIGAILAWRLRGLLLLLVVAMFIAALLNPLVNALQRHRLSRGAALGVVYGLMVVLITGLGYTFLHPVYDSAVSFGRQIPHLVRQAQLGKGQVGSVLKRLHLASYVASHAPSLQNAISKLGRPALSFGKTVLGGVASLVSVAFISFFILLEAPGLFRGLLSVMSPERAKATDRVARAMAQQVTGFMLGDLATSVIAGVVVYITLSLTSVPFALALSIWVGLVDFLPLVGGILAGVPTVGVAFLHSVPAGIITVVVFLVYQQVENHILYPVIISRTVRLNPLWVLLSVLVGTEVGAIIGSTFGAICGAILGVPAAGAVQVALTEIRNERLKTASLAKPPN